ncbi:hypothetical protein G5I_02211 [Acromyrmex echinatior]|uniref:Uncharacterized protein n=1 Tax=Acromyrmex echinatior TaxID=103372 RepID=F4W9Q7_ACREC|nr:hypothetical protein G5I_02211 [Acromyrmex echinatior]
MFDNDRIDWCDRNLARRAMSDCVFPVVTSRGAKFSDRQPRQSDLSSGFRREMRVAPPLYDKDIAEPVTLIARKPAAEEETSLVNIEGIKATLLMEWALKGRAGIGRAVRGKDGRRNEGSGEEENETRRDERSVKKQRASDGQEAAERRW